jgi:hypothetical protein
MVESYVDPSTNVEVFDNIDDELARRIQSFSVDEVSEILRVQFEHNNTCPDGYEIQLEMFIAESEPWMVTNMPVMSKH